MRRLEIHGTDLLRATLLSAMRASTHARFVHRLHCVALVGRGMSCYAVASLFGHHPRTIERWVRQWQCAGIEGLDEKPHGGRRPSLAPEQLASLGSTVNDVSSPSNLMWTGVVLQREIGRRFGVALSRRQCQRLLGALRSGSRAVDAVDAAGLSADANPRRREVHEGTRRM